MENDRIGKRVYVMEYAGTCSVGRPQKRWIDTVKDYISFRRPVKRLQFHALKQLMQSKEKHHITNVLHVGTGSRSVPNRWYAFPPE